MLLLMMAVEAVTVTAMGDEVRQDSAQSYLDSIDVALLTCEPHDEVYSLYGHTAIRVTDKRTGMDMAVNFGLFDSSAKNFALRFIFGLTDYRMGISEYRRFLEEYDYYGSGVREQHLNLSNEEKAKFMGALAEVAKPENIVYRYNFLYNNCTTRARDLILGALNGKVEYKKTGLQTGEWTFRELVHKKTSSHRWTSVGNDLLLGVTADFNTDWNEREFLPQVLMEDFDNAEIVGVDGKKKKLVDNARWVLPSTHPTVGNDTPAIPLTPMQCAWIFLVIVAVVSLAMLRIAPKTMPWFIYAVCCLYAMAGLVLLAMVFSQHPTVRVNLQILIFNPLLFFLAFPMKKWNWRSHVIVACILLFFIGNIVQCYAEGMNVIALALLLMHTVSKLGIKGSKEN